MEKVVVKPTWQLAWGLWWRLFLINLGIIAVIVGISYFAAGVVFWSWLRTMPMMPY